MTHDGETWEMVAVSRLEAAADEVEALRGENERLRAELEEATTVMLPGRETSNEYLRDAEDRLIAMRKRAARLPTGSDFWMRPSAQTS